MKNKTMVVFSQQPFSFDGIKPWLYIARMKTTLAERLKEARTLRGLTQKALGDLVGVSQAAIQKIETGKANQTTKLVELANALKVKPEWLSSGEGAMLLTGQDEAIPPSDQWGTVEPWDNSTPLPDDEVEVPFLKDIELACGDGTFPREDYNAINSASQKRLYAELMPTEKVLSASPHMGIAWSQLFRKERLSLSILTTKRSWTERFTPSARMDGIA